MAHNVVDGCHRVAIMARSSPAPMDKRFIKIRTRAAVLAAIMDIHRAVTAGVLEVAIAAATNHVIQVAIVAAIWVFGRVTTVATQVAMVATSIVTAIVAVAVTAAPPPVVMGTVHAHTKTIKENAVVREESVYSIMGRVLFCPPVKHARQDTLKREQIQSRSVHPA